MLLWIFHWKKNILLFKNRSEFFIDEKKKTTLNLCWIWNEKVFTLYRYMYFIYLTMLRHSDNLYYVFMGIYVYTCTILCIHLTTVVELWVNLIQTRFYSKMKNRFVKRFLDLCVLCRYELLLNRPTLNR